MYYISAFLVLASKVDIILAFLAIWIEIKLTELAMTLKMLSPVSHPKQLTVSYSTWHRS